ncbi:iron-containing alcohol dehydrogenase [Thermanaerosceptrum fracticalcis]|uniref:Glycerol dehydrogenase n=1 Tax=Thermanaerosceptrum fracticalcis TaxID=1712410 RepID=A0A7G6E7E3_THEFR|nr:glycerol dehydrogenase [Thermanaerosceptrum fracticalcis]QNB47997.1 iron-containing alcohol dehydrogenase [Thermanaerosceptrum fracticalcis]
MIKVMIAPSRYVQGPGALKELGKHCALLGKKGLVTGGTRGISSTKDVIEQSMAQSGVEVIFEKFNGECSKKEITRLKELAEGEGADFIVGVGGGKALDTAKAVAYYMKKPVVIIPTIAATDAPCSALSVIYTEDGVFEEYLVLPTNPDLVLVDTAIIAEAPVRLLVSGMGDALATWFEADACAKAFAGNIPGGNSTAAALALAKLCYDILLEYGLQAKLAVENGVATPAVEKIVEANTLLSGLGFESSGLAAAHAVHNGLTVLESTHHAYHGEKVAFGTLVQLVLEERSTEEINEVVNFCIDVGLPVTLEQIGVLEIKKEEIRKVAEAATAPGETIHNEPFPVDADKVYAAILTADAIGRLALKTKGV